MPVYDLNGFWSVQFRFHSARRVVAFGRIALHVVQNDLLDRGWNLWIQCAWRGWITNESSVHDGIDIGSLKGHLSCEHFVKDRAETIDVRTLVAALSFDLFRRHVIGRSHRRREPTKCDSPHGFVFSNTEVHDAQRAIVTEDDVGWL